jgi:hypothetical protein
MAENGKELTVYTFKEPVRMCYSNLVAARAFTPKKGSAPKGDPRFDATFLLAPDSPDLVALKDLVIAEAKAMFPGKRLIARRLTQEELDAGCVEIAVPWKDGTKQADKAKAESPSKDKEFMRGFIVVKASSKFAPALSGIEGGKIVEYDKPDMRPTLDKLFYGGAFVAPHVALHSYPAKDDKPGGVGLYVNAAIFIKHGPKIGGRSINAAEVFKGYAGTVSAEDPGSNDGDDEL